MAEVPTNRRQEAVEDYLKLNEFFKNSRGGHLYGVVIHINVKFIIKEEFQKI